MKKQIIKICVALGALYTVIATLTCVFQMGTLVNVASYIATFILSTIVWVYFLVGVDETIEELIKSIENIGIDNLRFEYPIESSKKITVIERLCTNINLFISKIIKREKEYNKLKQELEELKKKKEKNDNNFFKANEIFLEIISLFSIVLGKFNELSLNISKIYNSAEYTTSLLKDSSAKADMMQKLSVGNTDTVVNAQKDILVLQQSIEILKQVIKKIGGINKELQSIFVETKIISINASIEASNKDINGFSEVAKQFRELTEKSMLTSKETEDGIELQIKSAKSIYEAECEVERVFDQIEDKSNEMTKLSTELADIIKYQAISGEEITKAIENLNITIPELADIILKIKNKINELANLLEQNKTNV